MVIFDSYVSHYQRLSGAPRTVANSPPGIKTTWYGIPGNLWEWTITGFTMVYHNINQYTINSGFIDVYRFEFVYDQKVIWHEDSSNQDI